MKMLRKLVSYFQELDIFLPDQKMHEYTFQLYNKSIVVYQKGNFTK